MVQNKKILLIEDEMFIRELYQRVLKQAGFEVTLAVDGLQGLKLAKNQPHLILLDIMLPKINGIEVLKKLRADNQTKDIPVMLLTNLGQENIIKEALKIGAQGYLMKMRLTPYEIVGHVKDFLQNPNQKLDVNLLEID